ncbi:MAG: hypothetical protein ACRCVT_05575 [Leadbetterella sp.]
MLNWVDSYFIECLSGDTFGLNYGKYGHKPVHNEQELDLIPK